MRGPAFLLLTLLACAVAPAARAATVRSETVCVNPSDKDTQICSRVMTFQAAPGEANDVTADEPPGDVVIRDSGAPLTAGPGCTQLDAGSARCVRPSEGTASLGDGNDRMTLPASLKLDVAGEAGDDAIAAPGIIRGGDGDDALSGSGSVDGDAGNDRITGTAGDDVLFGDLGDDTIDGGPGADTVEYGPAPRFGGAATPTGPRPVTVDLADPAPDGAAGERDTLVSVENVTASDAPGDVLRGDDGPNVLRGVGGRDRLFGGGGDDELAAAGELDGGTGNDTLDGDFAADLLRGGDGDDRLAGDSGADVMEGGAGDDLLDASEHASTRTHHADELRCGSGRDRVSQPDVDDRAVSCERIAIGGGLVVDSSTLVKRSGPRVEVTVRCARSGSRCVTEVAAAAASGVAFNPWLRVRLAPGARRELVLRRFNPGGRTRLRRSKVIAFGTKDHAFAVRLRS